MLDSVEQNRAHAPQATARGVCVSRGTCVYELTLLFVILRHSPIAPRLSVRDAAAPTPSNIKRGVRRRDALFPLGHGHSLLAARLLYLESLGAPVLGHIARMA